MTDQDYIEKAIELLDWILTKNEEYTIAYSTVPTPDEKSPITFLGSIKEQLVLDHIAAELARRIDAIGERRILKIGRNQSYMLERCKEIKQIYRDSDFAVTDRIASPDRTMNTIKVVIDSRMLEQEKQKQAEKDIPLDPLQSAMGDKT